MSSFSDSMACFGFPLVGRARFRISGTDSFRYLNGQITQDLRRVTDQHALPACVTSAKGRLQAEVWVVAERQFSDQRAILVDAPGELREALQVRLERYIVADDVCVEDVSGRSEVVHFPSPQLPDFGDLAEVTYARADRLGQVGWDVWVPSEGVDSFCRVLGDRLGQIQNYERLRIERGIPGWGTELTEETLPPEAGLDRTHVDYHKGCYIGQEVISRLKSVGHVNRVLRRFLSDPEQRRAVGGGPGTESVPHVGDALHVLGEHERSIGNLTSVATDGRGAYVALGYVKRSADADCFETTQGVRFSALPAHP